MGRDSSTLQSPLHLFHCHYLVTTLVCFTWEVLVQGCWLSHLLPGMLLTTGP